MGPKGSENGLLLLESEPLPYVKHSAEKHRKNGKTPGAFALASIHAFGVKLRIRLPMAL
jgi:hypothetical protein